MQSVPPTRRMQAAGNEAVSRGRRMSHGRSISPVELYCPILTPYCPSTLDEKGNAPRRFLIDVDETIRLVLEQEDTDGDFQVSNYVMVLFVLVY